MKPSRTRRWLCALAAGTVGLALAASAAELLVLALAGEQPKFPRHVVRAPWGLRFNEPGARYRHKSRDVEVRFAINSQGMRAGNDVAYEKPAGVRRIVCVGDSFTVGYEVEDSDCFARVLERELRDRGCPVEVLNTGVSGFSTAEECLYLERELHKYQPNVVLLSFFENDYADNVRSGLFALSDGRISEGGSEYVPAGRLGDLLNTNPLLNLLSERSNAFAVFKERWTKEIKRGIVERSTRSDAGHPAGGIGPLDMATYERKLCAAILERIYAWTRGSGVALVIQSIPFPAEGDPARLVDKFPQADFDVSRPGIVYFAARDVLQPRAATDQLYWQHSHSHWTPLAHRLAGVGLADAIARAGLLQAARRARRE